MVSELQTQTARVIAIYKRAQFRNKRTIVVLYRSPFIKNLNDISYETTEPILMKFHIKHLYVGCTKFS